MGVPPPVLLMEDDGTGLALQPQPCFHMVDGLLEVLYTHNSDIRTGELRDRLPYYGELLFERIGTGPGAESDPVEKRYGRAPNPTVHVALNEVRRVVNAIIDHHGIPGQIVIETLRDFGHSAVQRREYETEQKKNQEANRRRDAMLEELNLVRNSTNRMRLRLWEEQAEDHQLRICPYTGRLITARMALSDEVEEDHILPFAQSLDDSAANRVLVMREANRSKARRTPFDAFGHTPQWGEIQRNIVHLPSNKRWRFEPDALQKFQGGSDFLARHLADSGTIARLARVYLDVLAPGKVWSTPGRLTAPLRERLGLNSSSVLGRGGSGKDRTDHRHHAIDAVVVALTDRSLLQRVSTAAGRSDAARGRVINSLGEPWPGFVSEVATSIRHIVVSYKPDTGWEGALHNDTNYGPVTASGPNQPNVVVGRPIESFADWKPEDVEQSVPDPVLRQRIVEAIGEGDLAERKRRLLTLSHSGGQGVRRARARERLDKVATIRDRRDGRVYRVVKLDSNHRAELWRMPDGKLKLLAVSTFDAAKEAEARRVGSKLADRRPHPAAKLLMKLHKNDMLAFGHGANRTILRVVKMREGTLTLAPHSEAGNLKARDTDRGDGFKYINASASRLFAEKARKVSVDPAGRVLDPGPSNG